MASTQTPGYKASKEQLLKRLARVEGQVRGVTRMLEEDRYCIDVLTQIEAAQQALNKIALGLVDDHVRNCMRGGQGSSEKQVEELMGAVGRLVSS
ncbi:MAG: metal-sensitive transcriptional regulator [Solirubrobacterales bacterium]|nr:metal-sensitive transcriptional regulator [Solirubrobacterales bacterium]